MRNRDALIDACCLARENPDFTPLSDGTTFCNLAVSFIASKMGCDELAGKMANTMCDYFSASPDKWTVAPIENVQALANQGSLVIACEKANPHGHVVVCIPGIQKTSGNWNTQVPACINVGRDVFIGKGVNYAFRELPTFYVWRQSL